MTRDEMRPGEVAELFGATIEEIRRAADKGTLPVLRRTFGGERRFDRKTMEDLKAHAEGVARLETAVRDGETR